MPPKAAAKTVRSQQKIIDRQCAQLKESRKATRQRDATINTFAVTLERVARQLRRNTTKARAETAKKKAAAKMRWEEWKAQHERDTGIQNMAEASDFVRNYVEAVFPAAAAEVKAAKKTKKAKTPIPAHFVPIGQRG